MNYTLKKITWIDCIFIPMEWSHSVTTRVWVKAGSDYETDKEWWISHFLEHLSFIWWKKWKTWQKLRDFVRDIWWEVNGLTWDYRTCYYVNSPYEYWKDQIEILGDMLVDAVYPDSAVESERGVVVQEIKRFNDDNVGQAYVQWRRFFMWDSSYSRNSLWTSENIVRFKKEDFLGYKAWLYTKDNIVIVVAWKISNQKEMEELIWQTFGKLPDKKSISLPSFERRHPSNHEMLMEKWINQARVTMFFRWISCVSEKSVSCDILAEIIRRRLFQKIREELWLCYGIRTVHINQVNYWFFLIEVWLKSDEFSFWLEKINEVIDDLLKNWVTKEEFNSIKKSKRWSMLINYETPSKVADFLADNYVTIDKIVFPGERAEEYSNIIMKSIEDLLPLLEKDNRYTFYIK